MVKATVPRMVAEAIQAREVATVWVEQEAVKGVRVAEGLTNHPLTSTTFAPSYQAQMAEGSL